MAKAISFLRVVIGGDITALQKALTQVERSIKKTTRQLDQVGKTLSTSLTLPLAALGAASVRNFDIQAKAIADVEAAVKSTGGAAGLTSKQLQEMASSLQDNSLFGDEAILKEVTANLLTFTKVSSDSFQRAQQAVLDLSTRMNVDLKSATIQVGKALNDPIGGITSLSRAGIQFTEQQKNMIKSLVETGKVSEAQSLILKELETQFGGAAEAASKAGLGPFKQLANSIGDLTEEFGKIIVDALTPFIDSIKNGIKWFQGLDEQAKKNIVTIAAIAAAIGPVVLIVSQMIKGFGTVISVLKLAISPIGLITIALAALAATAAYVYANWDAFKDRFQNLWTTIYNFMAKILTSIVRSIDSFVKKATFGLVDLGLDDFQIQLKEQVDPTPFKTFGESMKDTAKDVLGALGIMRKDVAANDEAVTSSFNNQTDAITDFGTEVEKAGEKLKYTREEFNKLVSESEGKLSQLLKLGDGIFGGGSIDIPKSVTSQRDTPQQVSGISQNDEELLGKMQALNNEIQDYSAKAAKARKETTDFFGAVSNLGGSLQNIFFKLNDSFDTADFSKFQEKAVKAADIIAAAFQGLGAIFTQSIDNQLAKLENRYSRERQLIEQSKLTEEQKSAALLKLDQSTDKKRRELQRKQAKANKAKAIFDAIINVASAVAEALPNIALSAIVGGLGAVQIGLIAAQPIPALAEGGILYGPSTVLAGEYAGANSNPEVIAPLDRLEEIINKNPALVQVVGRISGNDILLINERASQQRRRKAGF